MQLNANNEACSRNVAAPNAQVLGLQPCLLFLCCLMRSNSARLHHGGHYAFINRTEVGFV